jgi:hypothetical protein
VEFHPYYVRDVEARKHKEIRREWVLAALENVIAREVQPDGRIRCWGRVDTGGDFGVRVIRVILTEEGGLIFNAFFDRNFKG